jgi:hypothetical protein
MSPHHSPFIVRIPNVPPLFCLFLWTHHLLIHYIVYLFLFLFSLSDAQMTLTGISAAQGSWACFENESTDRFQQQRSGRIFFCKEEKRKTA